MRENRLSGLMRGGKQTVIGLVPLNPSLPAYSTEIHPQNVTILPETHPVLRARKRRTAFLHGPRCVAAIRCLL
jgi:hypothetical protein